MEKAKKGKVKEQKTYVHVEIDAEGRVNTLFEGNTLVLFGLMEVARQNLIQKLKPVPPVEIAK